MLIDDGIMWNCRILYMQSEESIGVKTCKANGISFSLGCTVLRLCVYLEWETGKVNYCSYIYIMSPRLKARSTTPSLILMLACLLPPAPPCIFFFARIQGYKDLWFSVFFEQVMHRRLKCHQTLNRSPLKIQIPPPCLQFLPPCCSLALVLLMSLQRSAVFKRTTLP